MVEVKVGQVWKWFEDDDTKFKVLSVGEEEATIEYLGVGDFVIVRPLFWWDSDSVLIKDVPQSIAVEDNQLSPNEDKVNHPSHYGGDTTYEVIKVAEAWGFDNDAYLFNVLKYIARAEHKGSERQDLEKAKFYLERRISNL